LRENTSSHVRRQLRMFSDRSRWAKISLTIPYKHMHMYDCTTGKDVLARHDRNFTKTKRTPTWQQLSNHFVFTIIQEDVDLQGMIDS
jgi:hypothetical protein